MPLHRVWEYRDIGRLFVTVGGESVIIGVLRWGWVEVILRISLEVILHHLLRQYHTLTSGAPVISGCFLHILIRISESVYRAPCGGSRLKTQLSPILSLRSIKKRGALTQNVSTSG